VTCWGENYWGQLGVNPSTTPQRNSPSGTLSLPGGPPTQAFALAAGDSHTCVLLDNGEAACWGYNGTGELGDGTLTTRFATATTAAQPYGSRIRTMSAGYSHNVVVLEDGSLSCWVRTSTVNWAPATGSICRVPNAAALAHCPPAWRPPRPAPAQR